MTVKELINKLLDCPMDSEVYYDKKNCILICDAKKGE